MKKTLAIVGILFLAVAIAIPVLAFGPGSGRGRGMGIGYLNGPGSGKGQGMGIGYLNRGVPYCQGLSNLTAEQSAKLSELREQSQKEVTPLRSELINKRAELRVLWTQASPDGAAINAKQKEINDLRAKIQERNTHYRLERQKLLTPEQRAQLQSQRWQKGYGQRAKRHGKGGYGRMGAW